MHRRIQFGMRENPASNRRHDSCSPSDDNRIERRNATSSLLTTGHDHLPPPAGSALNAAPPGAATGEKNGRPLTHPTVAPQSGSSVTIQREFEPLIDSSEAARLLGNIHVKTLQRYARHRNLPGYQIGGHWYFRASELDSWLRSRLNSNCQPADRVNLAQEENP